MKIFIDAVADHVNNILSYWTQAIKVKTVKFHSFSHNHISVEL